MSYEVDTGGVDMSIASALGTKLTMGLKWPGDIGPHQWYRLSLSIDPGSSPALPGDPPIYTNPAGTFLTIVSEGYGINTDGEQYTQFTIRNDSLFEVPQDSEVEPVTFTMNVVSTPSLH
jgi:hypothetical protein